MFLAVILNDRSPLKMSDTLNGLALIRARIAFRDKEITKLPF
jgi:hypothetical protein